MMNLLPLAAAEATAAAAGLCDREQDLRGTDGRTGRGSRPQPGAKGGGAGRGLRSRGGPGIAPPPPGRQAGRPASWQGGSASSVGAAAVVQSILAAIASEPPPPSARPPPAPRSSGPSAKKAPCTLPRLARPGLESSALKSSALAPSGLRLISSVSMDSIIISAHDPEIDRTSPNLSLQCQACITTCLLRISSWTSCMHFKFNMPAHAHDILELEGACIESAPEQESSLSHH
ncbi:uncharacterized protein [Petaurus breviceps papuanus]|uniref:uncharacterized protein n=1 Tax=Petaurus breviceps papuanus TaxID=3040969 RepID=UPI0036DD20FC